MRKQDQLISLIASLTQGERKFFKQTCQSQSGDKSYLKLYELLLKKESYNAEELCRLLGKNKAGLANEKKYLEKQLLAALRQYHASNPQVTVLNRLAESMILMEKNLPAQARVAVKASIDNAASLDLAALKLHAHGLMLLLTSDPFVSFSETGDTSAHHLAQMKTLASEIQHTVEFELLNSEVFEAYSRRKTDLTDAHKKETRKMLVHPLLKMDFPNFNLESYKYNLLAVLYSRLGDSDAAILVNRKCLALYEAQKTIDVWGYWNAISNLTQAIIMKGDAKTYSAWMAKLDSAYYRKLPVNGDYLHNLLTDARNVFTSGAYYKLLQKGELSAAQARAFTRHFLKSFAKEKERITASLFTSTVFRTAACSFMIGDLDDCIDMLNLLFNETDEMASPSVYKNAKLLFIMAHTEWNNYVLLPGLNQSVINYLKKVEQYGKSEQEILKLIGKLSRQMNVNERKIWFAEFKALIGKLLKNAQLRPSIEMLPYLTWVKRGLH